MFTLEKESKAAFYTLAEAWVMPAPPPTNPEEREFVIDSEASVHPMERFRRMNKQKFMCMIFTFSSLCSCSRTRRPKRVATFECF